MHQTLICLFLVCLMLPASLQGAREILLQLEPEADAPVIAKIIATDKVILDAAPTRQNMDAGWRQLTLPTPFEGYVPVASLNKNMAIVPGTPVRYLPTTQSAEITEVEDGDRYEVVREQNDWATVRFYKSITGYFGDIINETYARQPDASALLGSQISPEPERVESAFALPQPKAPGSQISAFAQSAAETQGSVHAQPVSQNQTPTVEPLTIPAPRRSINPDAPISQLDPDRLPPENVIWKPASAARSEAAARSESESESNPTSPKTLRSSQSEGGRTSGPASRVSDPASRITNPASRTSNPPSRISNPTSRITNPASRISNPASPIMVTPDHTQAREDTPDLGPAKTPRLLTGQLVRQIEVDGPGYPIRLKSPEGRLIAFVDLSRIYLPDIDPYLGKKVYLRGQIHPLPNTSGQLVILAETLRLSD